MSKQPTITGMDHIDIKAALERRGWSLRRLSAAYGYSPSVAGKALRHPCPDMEWIIADVIGKSPWEIWPSRYPDGPVSRPERKRGNGYTYPPATGRRGPATAIPLDTTSPRKEA